ncbi:MAG: hypothetical protein HN370_03960 [Phycisphaerales bacterium]|nr:hypothetical protein [Phycisphaerales bacterium]
MIRIPLILSVCLLVAGCDGLATNPSAAPVARASASAPGPMAESDAKRIAHNAAQAYRNTSGHNPRAAEELANSTMILLSCGDSATRAQAATHLGELRHAAAEEPLRLALMDPSPSVRRETCASLGRIKRPAAAFAVARCFTDAHATVQIAAFKAAGRLGNPAVLPAILKAIPAALPAVQTVAVRSAGLLAPKAAPALGRQCVATLAASSLHRDIAVRSAATAALGRIASPEALAPLLVAARDPQPLVRFQAAGALKRYCDPQAAAALTKLRADTNLSVQAAAK